MKLRNKKTGEIVEWEHGLQYKLGKTYGSIKEFAEEWEDYEEPKDYWYINGTGDVIRAVYKTDDLTRSLAAIGNYFETPEEAEKAVKKLEAWKRLKDKGFKLEGWYSSSASIDFSFNGVRYNGSESWPSHIDADMELLFGDKYEY